MATDPRSGAAAPAGQAHGQRRHPAPSIGDQLVRASGDLDRLIRDWQLGVRSVQTYAELEERAQHIAAAVQGAFRKPADRPVNPPVWISPDGRSAGW